MREVFIAPSLLSANKNDFNGEINRVTKLGAKYIHFDVMGLEFIGHTSFSADDFAKVKASNPVISDVHLMVAKPYEYAETYAKLGADIITVHFEAIRDNTTRIDCLNYIHSLGKKAGISIKPNTPVEKVLPLLRYCDLVLIMSVEPGLGGQSFIESSLNKISACRKFIDENKFNCLIEVDGGINETTGAKCYKAGADILVAGSYLYGHDDLENRYINLINKCYE